MNRLAGPLDQSDRSHCAKRLQKISPSLRLRFLIFWTPWLFLMKDYCPRVASAMLLVYFNEPDFFWRALFTRTGEGLEAFKICDFRDQQVVRFLWTQKKNMHI
uniref:Uncharacterized protein n=1 Tax=Anguilla anguilla TaxID=7936 RepID=A0A0E9X7E7_ANGAN